MSFDYPAVQSGRYSVSMAETPDDLRDAQVFRAWCFGLRDRRDADALDERCTHILIRDRQSNALVCCYRMLLMPADDVSGCYADQFYDIDLLSGFGGQLLEMGRFCIDPQRRDPDVLRLAWSAMTACVDAHSVTLLFGCTSFSGTDPTPYRAAFGYLHKHALAPSAWAPRRKATQVYPFAAETEGYVDKGRALKQMPPLLRTYLGMGGWVSDHAVIDPAMNTLHVFTGVETAAIPPARQRLLRGLCKNTQPAD